MTAGTSLVVPIVFNKIKHIITSILFYIELEKTLLGIFWRGTADCMRYSSDYSQHQDGHGRESTVRIVWFLAYIASYDVWSRCH